VSASVSSPRTFPRVKIDVSCPRSTSARAKCRPRNVVPPRMSVFTRARGFRARCGRPIVRLRATASECEGKTTASLVQLRCSASVEGAILPRGRTARSSRGGGPSRPRSREAIVLRANVRGCVLAAPAISRSWRAIHLAASLSPSARGRFSRGDRLMMLATRDARWIGAPLGPNRRPRGVEIISPKPLRSAASGPIRATRRLAVRLAVASGAPTGRRRTRRARLTLSR